jgi:hypothetical protein
LRHGLTRSNDGSIFGLASKKLHEGLGFDIADEAAMPIACPRSRKAILKSVAEYVSMRKRDSESRDSKLADAEKSQGGEAARCLPH